MSTDWADTVIRLLPQWFVLLQAMLVFATAVYAFRQREVYILSRWYLLGIGLAVIPAAVFYLDASLTERTLAEYVALSRISRVFLFGILGSILLSVSWNGREH